MSILLAMNNNRLQSLLLCFVFHMSNIIQLNLNYKTIEQRKLLISYISECAMWNSIKRIILLTFKNQSINRARVIEITKTHTAAFEKARNSLVI